MITTTVIAKRSDSWTERPTIAYQATNVPSAAHERDQHQPERRPVGEPLAGGLRVLSLLDELDDLGERGVRADRRGAGAQGAPAVDGGTDERGARALRHGHALAGHHRLVDVARALEHLGVDRHLRARPDQQQVADRAPRRWGPRPARRRAARRPSAARGRAARGWRRWRRRARASRTSARAARTPPAGRRPRRRPRPRSRRWPPPSRSSRCRSRRRRAPSCRASAPAARARRRGRRSTTSRRSPAGSAGTARGPRSMPNGVGEIDLEYVGRRAATRARSGPRRRSATRKRLRMSRAMAVHRHARMSAVAAAVGVLGALLRLVTGGWRVVALIGHRVAEAARRRAPRALEPALLDPPGELGERRPLGVVGHGRGLGRRVGRDVDHSGPPAERPLDDGLLARVVQPTHVQDVYASLCRSRGRGHQVLVSGGTRLASGARPGG